MHNPDTEYVTNLNPQGETGLDNVKRQIKYMYWMMFVMLIILVSVILYAYLKGVPVKVR